MCIAGMYDKQNNKQWTGQTFKIRFEEDIHDNWFKSEKGNLAHHTLSAPAISITVSITQQTS